ncbi:MAG: hypothetical protein VXW43_03165, partial [Pseudomonadota bacterium]|nr:hypothetical protein [Pseudomonadota bacterium]
MTASLKILHQLLRQLSGKSQYSYHISYHPMKQFGGKRRKFKTRQRERQPHELYGKAQKQASKSYSA